MLLALHVLNLRCDAFLMRPVPHHSIFCLLTCRLSYFCFELFISFGMSCSGTFLETMRFFETFDCTV
ncbi:hypothetical protein CW304_17880 [Bacillus sp. UFRGS-B20]|nr:hypothetical protein CW304_17880 [Bacillus sp. UFRGS-B20]